MCDSSSILLGGRNLTVAGPARALNGLVTEVALLMNPTKELVESPYLWQYLEVVALPILRHHLHVRKSSQDFRAYDSTLSSGKRSRRKLLSDIFGRKCAVSMHYGESPSTSATIELTEVVFDVLEDTFTQLRGMSLFQEAQSSHG